MLYPLNTGPRGLSGPAGRQGVKGDTGPAGLPGPTGRGWHTLGGRRPHAQTSLEHNSCMQEEQLEVIITTKAVEPTTSA